MRWRGALALVAILLVPSLADAEPAGPPPPAPPPKLSPAEQAIAAYKTTYGPVRTPQPCLHKPGEITVCATPDRSPYRIPLPDERASRPHPGEFNRVDIGTGPVPVKPGFTVARFGMGKRAKERNATLKLIYAQEEAKAAQAARDKAAIVDQPRMIGP